MTYEQLTAEQALEIANLKEKVALLENDRQSVRNLLYRVGGPLNDNALGYSGRQLTQFFQIEVLTEPLERS